MRNKSRDRSSGKRDHHPFSEIEVRNTKLVRRKSKSRNQVDARSGQRLPTAKLMMFIYYLSCWAGVFQNCLPSPLLPSQALPASGWAATSSSGALRECYQRKHLRPKKQTETIHTWGSPPPDAPASTQVSSWEKGPIQVCGWPFVRRNPQTRQKEREHAKQEVAELPSRPGAKTGQAARLTPGPRPRIIGPLGPAAPK